MKTKSNILKLPKPEKTLDVQLSNRVQRLLTESSTRIGIPIEQLAQMAFEAGLDRMIEDQACGIILLKPKARRKAPKKKTAP